MKKIIAKTSSLFAGTIGAFALSVRTALAQVNTEYDEISESLGNEELESTIEYFINAFLAVLALIAVILILVGGFQWMTAAGNDDKVATAKKTLVAAIIGLLIILAAWAVTNFFLREIQEATGAV